MLHQSNKNESSRITRNDKEKERKKERRKKESISTGRTDILGDFVFDGGFVFFVNSVFDELGVCEHQKLVEGVVKLRVGGLHVKHESVHLRFDFLRPVDQTRREVFQVVQQLKVFFFKKKRIQTRRRSPLDQQKEREQAVLSGY